MRLVTWIACAAVVLAPVACAVRFNRIVDYKIDQALHDMEFMRVAIKQRAAAGHRLPTDAEGLESLATGDDKSLDRVPTDPWRHAYIYRRTPEPPGFVLYSAGYDGVDDHGTGDDVTTFDKSYDCETYYGECPGSEPWFEKVGIAAAFLGGLGWLARNLVVAIIRGLRRRQRA